MLKLTLRKPLANGEKRRLTPLECEDIRRCGTSVRPYYGNSWQLVCDDDGSLAVLWMTKNNIHTWAIEENLPEEVGTLDIALSTPIAVGESRSPSITELHAIFDCGITALPGAQLTRLRGKGLRLVCGSSQWTVQVISEQISASSARQILDWRSLSKQSRCIIMAIF